VSTFDPRPGFSEDRNVGDAKIEGIDAQLGPRFGDAVTLTLGASYNDSELEGSLNPALDGKKLVETPEWTYSARMDSRSPKTCGRSPGKKVRRSLLHRPERRSRAGLHRGRHRPELRLQAAGLRARRAAAQLHQPARRRVLRQHQLGHGRNVGGLLLDRSPRTFVASIRFDF
jgi:hypothetical protein